MPRTQAQKDQDRNRSNKSGKFRKGPQCDFCNKPAGHDYMSDDESLSSGAGDLGLFVCARVRCIAKRDALNLAERQVVYAEVRKARQAAG